MIISLSDILQYLLHKGDTYLCVITRISSVFLKCNHCQIVKIFGNSKKSNCWIILSLTLTIFLPVWAHDLLKRISTSWVIVFMERLFLKKLNLFALSKNLIHPNLSISYSYCFFDIDKYWWYVLFCFYLKSVDNIIQCLLNIKNLFCLKISVHVSLVHNFYCSFRRRNTGFPRIYWQASDSKFIESAKYILS